ncbi:MAG: hypothetical protein ABI854_00060 [Betaproteobacteria bacterium]
MFRHLRLRSEPVKVAPDPRDMPILQLDASPTLPISIYAINNLSENAKRRLYRTLLPPSVLMRFRINPVSWDDGDGVARVMLAAAPGSSTVSISVMHPATSAEPFFLLELGDNNINGFELHFISLCDPDGPRFDVDRDAEGSETHFGTVRRNLSEEERAMGAGLAPIQLRRHLGAAQLVFEQLELFMAFAAHQAYSLEPLTYAAAWVFERRGFAYVRGHKLMNDIHREFQPGGRLHAALDGSSPFRQAEQWHTVRGRAWAIHDGILESIGQQWGQLRMIKQLGRHAGVETFPAATY